MSRNLWVTYLFIRALSRKGVVEVGKEVEAAVDANLRQRAKEKELVEIEELINGWIGDATLLQTKVMPLADAKRAGAIAMFGEKYGEQSMASGAQVSDTSTLVHSPSALKTVQCTCCRGSRCIHGAMWRIEAVAGDAFIEYVNARDNHMRQLCSTLKVKAEEVTTRVEALLEELRMTRNEVSAVRAKAAVYKASVMAGNAFPVGTSKKIRVLVESMDDIDADSLKSAAEYLIDTLQDPAAVILGSCPSEEKVSLVAAFTPGVVDLGIQAGKFIGPIAKLCGGGGGGRPNFAQAGGRKPENLSGALEKARESLLPFYLKKQAEISYSLLA
ncbi:Alanine--tRNA ligase, chloroplastic/mitochondrial [Vitis vinifera]|uniref:Alanine--tRNA ligase n=1 Tax=Vitis vinifera TaxID=29760 RepID=A0A438EL12_VITVI|nr:Alanine--tRNA ligase, chloroplastic/mitochondrial [Vitis vinifera]